MFCGGKERAPLPYFIISLRLELFYRATELVGARCRLAIATYALEACYDVLVTHALDKTCNTLQIAVATAEELNIGDNAIVASNFNKTRACTLCTVSDCFH